VQHTGSVRVSLRYFNAAGADSEGDIGEAHSPETHLIPLVLRAAQEGTAVCVFGNDYETADGSCVRDYVHVTDIADAHVHALHYLLVGGGSVALNLANSRNYSVLEVVNMAENVCGRPVKVDIAPRRAGDPSVPIGDAKRAKSSLNWTPTRSALETQILDAWNWVNGSGQQYCLRR